MSDQGPKTVLVLGAGFTKAFFPKAPLVEDYYHLAEVKQKIQGLAHAQKILNAELGACGNEQREGKDKVNVERLMTRLDTGMPYDKHMRATEELAVVLSAVKLCITDALHKDRSCMGSDHPMADVAKEILASIATCITFNWDDLLDEALNSQDKCSDKAGWWDPVWGYGFHCNPVGVLAAGVGPDDPLELLKLHGSINWRVQSGSRPPHPIEDIRQDPRWLGTSRTDQEWAKLEYTLEPDPFIVPPLLSKSDYLREPLLQLVWSHARQALAKAERVVFVGYSFPATDFAARFLFTEAIPEGCAIRVVNYAGEGDDQQKQQVKAAYWQIFPGVKDEQFDFAGAQNSRIWDDL